MRDPCRLHRAHRRDFGAALVCSLFAPGSGPAQGHPEARVHRDRAGIPHSESASEIGLFHAVGYMQAADQMPVIALNA